MFEIFVTLFVLGLFIGGVYYLSHKRRNGRSGDNGEPLPPVDPPTKPQQKK